MRYIAVPSIIILFFLSLCASAQQTQGNTPAPTPAAVGLFPEGGTGVDSVAGMLTLKDCLKYALKNQPALNQSYIDQDIARQNNKIAISGWLPQVSGAATYGHYFQSPISVYPINGVLTPYYEGSFNYSIPSLAVNQTIFSPDILLAVKASKINKLLSAQNTEAVKIELVSDVSKAFLRPAFVYPAGEGI